MTAGPKRFYTVVKVTDEAPFGVLLDDRPLKTPAGALQAVPSRALALAMAEEWRAQGDRLDLTAMALTRAANTAIDRIEHRRNDVLDELARFVGSDLLCYRAEAPRELVERQNATWNPWLDWANKELGLQLRVAAGIVHVEQDQAAVETMRKAMDTLDSFAIAALHPAVTITGSAVLGLAFARRLMNHEEALAVSCVDEDYQAERWGRDSEAETVRKNRLAELALARRLLDLLAS